MGYYEYICAQLEPLGLYALYDGAGAEELRCAGKALDALSDALERLERESSLRSAREQGLEAMEALLPFVPASGDLAGRREASGALLQIDGGSFTPQALNQTISGCGISAAVTECPQPFTVEVRFPGTRGQPERFEALRARLEQILPCHLDIRYVFRYLRWEELEAAFGSWQALEARVGSWNALEKYVL